MKKRNDEVNISVEDSSSQKSLTSISFLYINRHREYRTEYPIIMNNFPLGAAIPCITYISSLLVAKISCRLLIPVVMRPQR